MKRLAWRHGTGGIVDSRLPIADLKGLERPGDVHPELVILFPSLTGP
jgi:hypothetical protein